MTMQRICDPQASPDGSQVAFVVRTTDFEANRGRNDLWLVDMDGGGRGRLTTDAADDTAPRWSPDGKRLYFLSTRSGSSQVWRIAVAGGDKDAVQVTDLPLDVANLLVSPDGSRLAFSRRGLPRLRRLSPAPRSGSPPRRSSRPSAALRRRLFVRHWDAWEDGRRNHLFTLPLAPAEPTGPAASAVDLTAGDGRRRPRRSRSAAPRRWAFSPDGASLVFARPGRREEREEAWSTNFDLYEVPVDGSARAAAT